MAELFLILVFILLFFLGYAQAKNIDNSLIVFGVILAGLTIGFEIVLRFIIGNEDE